MQSQGKLYRTSFILSYQQILISSCGTLFTDYYFFVFTFYLLNCVCQLLQKLLGVVVERGRGRNFPRMLQKNRFQIPKCSYTSASCRPAIPVIPRFPKYQSLYKPVHSNICTPSRAISQHGIYLPPAQLPLLLFLLLCLPLNKKHYH